MNCIKLLFYQVETIIFLFEKPIPWHHYPFDLPSARSVSSSPEFNVIHQYRRRCHMVCFCVNKTQLD